MSKLRVVKPLDNNMVKYINSLPDGTTIEFDNTKGQNKEYFKIIKNTITIRIIGGLNEVEKPKFNTQEYYDRTLYKPSEVFKIIDKMEQIESKINPSWNDLEKAMYIYKTMCEGMKYDHIDVPYKGRDLNRNLLGFLTGKSVCAGFAMMYKEMLDRQGIRCLYQNKQHGHSWNLVEIDGKLVPVDLTWDNTLNEKDNNRCDFAYFGRNKDFFKNPNHQVSGEKVHQTDYLTDNEVINAYKKITKKTGIHSKMNSYKDRYGKITYYLTINEGKYKRSIFVCGNKIQTAVYDNTMTVEEILSYGLYKYDKEHFEFSKNRDEIQHLRNHNKCISKYKRDDGSEFLLITSGKIVNNLIGHKYIEINKEKDGTYLDGETLNSDKNLVQEPDTMRKGIANILLSKSRIIDKINRFNGYVGYPGMENGRFVKFYNEEVERQMGINR